MRPPRQDIAAPPLPPGSTWIGADEVPMERLADRGPVLVWFFDFAQLNSLRTLPYVAEWNRRYAGEGLTTLGIHASRFPFTEDPATVAEAVERLGIGFPVIVDEHRIAWDDYGCQGWPSLFLWSQGGALRWAHFGEGAYQATEEAIRLELEDVLSLPAPMDPLRPGDAEGALVAPPTAELLPGGSEREPWRASGESPSLEIPYEAGGAWASLAGSGTLVVTLDGEELAPIQVAAPGLYELAPEGPHGAHTLVLHPDHGVEIYSVSFAAAPAR